MESDVNAKATNAIQYMMGKGWTLEQASGLVGNLLHESRLETNVLGDKKFAGINQAMGIAQWRGSRRTQFQTLYGKPLEQASLQEQLDYVDWELRNTEAGAGKALGKSKDLMSATSTVRRLYERPQNRPEEDSWRYNKIAGVYGALSGKKVEPLTSIPGDTATPNAPTGNRLLLPQQSSSPGARSRIKVTEDKFALPDRETSPAPLRDAVRQMWSEYISELRGDPQA